MGRRFREPPAREEPLEGTISRTSPSMLIAPRSSAATPFVLPLAMFSNSDLSAVPRSLPADAGAELRGPLTNGDEPAIRLFPSLRSNRSVPVAFSSSGSCPRSTSAIEELRRRIGHQPASSVFTVTQPEMCLGKQSANKHTELRPRPLVQTAARARLADSALGPWRPRSSAVARALEHHFRSA